ncbi:Plasmodium vivax Vir protein, putative [Plasmodium vivax]|nr:Plasmodium vivax Vir protein, putative [Plasmodium vivax]
MEESIYNFVYRFPQFESDISGIVDRSSDAYKGDCQKFTGNKLNSYDDIKGTFPNKCAKIVHHLEAKKVENDFKPAFCKYINYWLYDTLKDIDSFSKKNELLNAFYDTIGNLNVCQDYKKHIDKDIYIELNELYKLHEHLIKYKKGSTPEQQNYCNHAKEGAELYESHVRNKCRWVYNPDYCSSLEKFKNEYENHRSTDTKCLESMKYLTPVGYNPEAYFLIATFAMSIISFVFIYFYKFTSFGSWLRPRLPGGKNKTKKLEKKIQEFKNTPDVRNGRYTLPYHSSYS